MTLSRRVELRWQEELIELWLAKPDISVNERTGLLAILGTVTEERETLEFRDTKMQSDLARRRFSSSSWIARLDRSLKTSSNL